MSVTLGKATKTVPVLYLDLDGTVRKGYDELGKFVNKATDVELFDGIADRLKQYKEAGFRIIGVSNQGGISLGVLTFDDCAAAMMKTQELTRNAFDTIAFCIHHPDARDPEFSRCWCRKPRAGLLIESALNLAAVHNEAYPPYLSLFVGDREEDKGCADACNIDFMWAKEWRDADPQTIIQKYRLP